MHILLTVISLLLGLHSPGVSQSGDKIRLKLKVERVEWTDPQTLKLVVTLENQGDERAFVEASGEGGPRRFHSVNIFKRLPNGAWQFVGPTGDLQALSVIAVEPRHSLASEVILRNPYPGAARQEIQIEGEIRAKLRYFTSEEEWRKIISDLNKGVPAAQFKFRTVTSKPIKIARRPT